MNAFVAMAVLAGMSVDEAVASLAPAGRPLNAETKRQMNLLRSPDRALRAHALAVGVASIVRGLEALDVGAKSLAPTAGRPS